MLCVFCVLCCSVCAQVGWGASQARPAAVRVQLLLLHVQLHCLPAPHAAGSTTQALATASQHSLSD